MLSPSFTWHFRAVPLKHIAFDLDGTLIDTRDQIVESIAACVPTRAAVRIRKALRDTTSVSPKAVLHAYGIHSLIDYWRHHAANVGLAKLYAADTKRLLRELNEAGFTLSLVTSLPAPPAHALLQAFHLDDCFSLVDTYASRRFRKPSPKLLIEHLSVLKVLCENAAYVGDSVGDMAMAAGARARAWGAGWGVADALTLKRAGSVRVFRSLQELAKTAQGR